MARKSSLRVVLTEECRCELSRWLRASKTPAGLSRRAWAILLVADGKSLAAAGRQVGLSTLRIRKWVKRFLKDGLSGLLDAKRSGRPPTFSPSGGDVRGEDRLRIAG